MNVSQNLEVSSDETSAQAHAEDAGNAVADSMVAALVAPIPAAPVKGKGKTKRAAKPAPIVEQETAQEPAPVAAPVIGFITPGAMPTAGASLFAHTSVFLNLSGIASAPIPSATARKIIGPRAVKYHTDLGNFADTAQGLALTEQGREKFGKRAISAELYAAWLLVLTEGKPADAVGIKNPAVIRPI